MTIERKATHNSTLAIGGVPSPLDSFVVGSSAVLRLNFCTKNPPLRQAAVMGWFYSLINFKLVSSILIT